MTALADNLTMIEPLGHTIIALPAPITTEADAIAWAAHLDFVSNEIEEHDAILIVPFGDIDAATAFAAYAKSQTSYRMIAACYHGSTELPELSASLAGAIAALPDVATPLDDTQLLGLTAVDSSFKLTRTRIEAALHAGVAMIATDSSGTPAIVRLITTYQDTPDGSPDDLMIDVNAPLIVAYTRVVMRQAVKAMGPRKNTVKQRRNVNTTNYKTALMLDRAEILQNVEANKDQFTQAQDPNDRTRAKYGIPTDIVPGMHIKDVTLNVFST